jgi:hypothetical protein
MSTTSIHPVKRFFFSLRFKLSFYVGFVMFLTIVAFAYHSVSLQEEHLVNARVQEALKDSEVIKGGHLEWHDEERPRGYKGDR